MEIRIEEWPVIRSNDLDAIKRIEAAKKIRKKIVDFDRDNCSMTIQGSASEPYIASMSHCTCPDFAIQKKPCKHMYALAFELNLLDDLPVYNKGTYDPQKDIDHYQEMYENGQIDGDSYVKICSILNKL